MRSSARLLPAAASVIALLVTACGGTTSVDDSAAATTAAAADAATRTVEHALGTAQIPADPQRVVTTTDQNALLPLLELGYTPVGSAGLLDEEAGTQTFRRTEGFDTSGIEFVGAYGEPNAEAIAALDPDLIVGYEFDSDYAAQLEAIAPFVAVQVFGRRLPEALLEFGDVVGRLDRAEQLQVAYDERVAALKAQIDERHPDLTVSILSPETGGQFYLGDEGQAVGTVAYDLDLGRPVAQADADRLGATFTDAISLERVDDHDADVLLVLDYGGDAGTGEYDPATQEFLASSLVRRLEAAERDQLVVIDGSKTVGAAWARMDAFLDDLEEVLLADDLVVTGVNGT
jgi:iron complex transport system substrate-binding protein